MAQDLAVPLSEISNATDRLRQLPLQQYVTEQVGEPTLRDILSELEKPGRDPRAEFTYSTFAEGVNALSDLKVGMLLEGVVTNVANFGAFVDIGVHQDGLVHISQMANRFVKDPKEIVQVGQVVKVSVVDVEEKLKRISLSMKLGGANNRKGESQKPASANPQKTPPDARKKGVGLKPRLKPTKRSASEQLSNGQPKSATAIDSEALKQRFNRSL